jgi:hypothetical protein
MIRSGIVAYGCFYACWLIEDDGTPIREEASGENGMKEIRSFKGLKVPF